MKIVFCTQNMAPFRMRWMDEIAKFHEVIIYHLGEYEEGLNPKYISYTPERAVVKNSVRSLFNNNRGYVEKDIINESANVYILDGYGFVGQQILILKLKRMGIPFILSIDGGFVRKNENIIKKWVKSFFVSKANAYFSTSNETDEYIDYYGGKNKTKYRHLFSNIMNDYIAEKCLSSDEKRILRTELDMKDCFTVVTVGKFEHRKGFDLLLNSIEMIDEDIRFYFIGANNYSEYIDFITDKNREKIQFIDFCVQEKLQKYYLASDLFVLPTREDIWGLVISEAMANGLPVVTTNRCLAGIAMLNNDDLIQIEDIVGLKNAILRYYYMSQETRCMIGNKNIEKVKPYSIENSSKHDLESLENFVNERNK